MWFHNFNTSCLICGINKNNNYKYCYSCNQVDKKKHSCYRCYRGHSLNDYCDNCVRLNKLEKLERKKMISNRNNITNLDQIDEYEDTLNSKWKIKKYTLYVEIEGKVKIFKNFAQRVFKNKETYYKIYILHDVNSEDFYIKLNPKNRINVKYCDMCGKLSFGRCDKKDCYF